MRFLLVLASFILLTPLTLLAGPYYGKVFVDKEDGEYLSVFNDPGMDYDGCSKNKSCEVLGWLDKDSEVEIISPPVVVPKLDVYTKKVVDTEFVQVEFSYVRSPVTKTKVIGWVESASLRKDKVATFYGADPEPIACPPASVTTKKAAPILESKEMKRAADNKLTVATAKAISPYVGTCALDDPKKLPRSFNGPIPYNNYVLPKMNSQPVPNLTKEGGLKVTRQDMIDVDAMARTVYAEMARCYKYGLHYPSAVARITLNRANPPAGRVKEFVCTDKLPKEGAITDALTCAKKYSAWNPVVNGERNPVLPQALCPPAPQNPLMWTGAPPSKAEKEIWENTLRIATESVLFPNRFKSRSPNLTQLHYTSDMPREKYTQVHPKIEGRTIDKDYCMMIWQE